jgi:hypothetical protein
LNGSEQKHYKGMKSDGSGGASFLSTLAVEASTTDWVL